MRVYVGFDPIDATAFSVAVASLRAHSSIPIETIEISGAALKARGLYDRKAYDRDGQLWDAIDDKPFSTDFSFGRFGVVPLEMMDGDGDEWVLFTDPDVLWRADVAELLALADDHYAVMCAKHRHRPNEATKMVGQIQTRYPRKNWSSVMLIKPSRCPRMTAAALNRWTGAELHRLGWVYDDEIGALPEVWNWLVGVSPTTEEGSRVSGHRPDLIKLVHFTRGTPDMPGRECDPFAEEWRSYLPEQERASSR